MQWLFLIISSQGVHAARQRFIKVSIDWREKVHSGEKFHQGLLLRGAAADFRRYTTCQHGVFCLIPLRRRYECHTVHPTASVETRFLREPTVKPLCDTCHKDMEQ